MNLHFTYRRLRRPICALVRVACLLLGCCAPTLDARFAQAQFGPPPTMVEPLPAVAANYPGAGPVVGTAVAPAIAPPAAAPPWLGSAATHPLPAPTLPVGAAAPLGSSPAGYRYPPGNPNLSGNLPPMAGAPLPGGQAVAPASFEPESIAPDYSEYAAVEAPLQASAFAAPSLAADWNAMTADAASWDYHVEGKGRAYYLNDQRFEFTGQEATFGVEGVLAGGVGQQFGAWRCDVEGEFFLNQPFDRNILVDAPIRESFKRNFEPDIFQISQFYFSARKDDLYFAFGRFVTPFGKFYYPQYTNNFIDGPFLRSEVIYNRETGALAQWDPGWLVMTAALTNGGPERDANSSKAFIGRLGVDFGWLTAGVSIKEHDGVSSEGQKQFNNHVGLDAMMRFGRWVVSGEAVKDQYGFRRPGYDPLDIFWGRSIYFRDLNQALMDPIEGWGYYVGVGYEGDRWNINLNYGDYFPEQIGVPQHDPATHRGVVKVAYRPAVHWEIYGFTMLENSVPLFANKVRHGVVYSFGTQFVF